MANPLTLKQALLNLGWKVGRRGHLFGRVGTVPTRAVFKERVVRLDTPSLTHPGRRRRIGGAYYGQCKINCPPPPYPQGLANSGTVVIIGGTVIK